MKNKDININPIIRCLGIALAILIVAVIFLTIFANKPMPIDVIIGEIIFVVMILPICVLGYIPAKLLNKLPNSIVNAIILEKKENNK